MQSVDEALRPGAALDKIPDARRVRSWGKVQLEKLDVQNIEVVIVTAADPELRRKTADTLAEALVALGRTQVAIVEAGAGVRLTTLNDEQLKRIGLQRIPATLTPEV